MEKNKEELKALLDIRTHAIKKRESEREMHIHGAMMYKALMNPESGQTPFSQIKEILNLRYQKCMSYMLVAEILDLSVEHVREEERKFFADLSRIITNKERKLVDELLNEK